MIATFSTERHQLSRATTFGPTMGNMVFDKCAGSAAIQATLFFTLFASPFLPLYLVELDTVKFGR